MVTLRSGVMVAFTGRQRIVYLLLHDDVCLKNLLLRMGGFHVFIQQNFASKQFTTYETGVTLFAILLVYDQSLFAKENLQAADATMRCQIPVHFELVCLQGIPVFTVLVAEAANGL